jgi:Domain of unknown function (DUF4803)
LQQIEKLLNKLKSDEDMVKLLIDSEAFESETLLNVADGIISNKHDSVTSQMAAIFNMVIGTPSSSGHNFIDLFMQSLEVFFSFKFIQLLHNLCFQRTQYHKVCHLQTSPQQAFLELFKIIMTAEMRTLELGNQAYALKMLASKKKETNENYTIEAYLLRDVFENRTMYYAEVIQLNIHRLSSKFFICDPEQRTPDSFQKFDVQKPYVSLKPQESDLDRSM